MHSDYTFDPDWLNTILDRGGKWDFGTVKVLRSTRIGAEFGLSGLIFRLDCMTTTGDSHSLVAKVESTDRIERAVAFRRHAEGSLNGSIPASYGWDIDKYPEHGVVLLEDVAPATQGDNLSGCSTEQAEALVAVVARVHSLGSFDAHDEVPEGAGRWTPQPWEADRWEDRLARAGERYPRHYTREFAQQLASFNNEANDAQFELAASDRTWTHQDPHLDNVLWLPGGAPVLLDWSGALIAPASHDVAGLLMSLAFRETVPIGPEMLLDHYIFSLGRRGIDVDRNQVIGTASLALRPLIRGMIGWAGFPNGVPVQGRSLALRDDSVAQVLGALRWLSRCSQP